MWYAGRPDRAVSTDDTRPAWTRVYLHVPKAPKGKDAVWMGTLDATDAYQAVTLPVHFNDQDAPAAGAYECPAEAFKCKKSDPDLVFDAKALTLTRGEQTFHVRKAGASGVQPIDVAKLKNGEESTWEVGFNVDLLKKAAAGLDEPVVAGASRWTRTGSCPACGPSSSDRSTRWTSGSRCSCRFDLKEAS